MMQNQFTMSSSRPALILIVLILLGSSIVVAAEQNKVHINAARKAISQMEYESAATELTRHLKLHPDDTRVMHLLAKVYSWDNRYEDSIKVYDKLLKINPDETDFLTGKARALIWLENYSQAIPLLEKAWQQEPDNAGILRNLIISLNQSRSPEHKQRARELSQTAQKKFPDIPWDVISD